MIGTVRLTGKVLVFLGASWLLVACQGSPSGGAGGADAAPDRMLAEVDGVPVLESQVDARLSDIPSMSRPEYSSPIGKQRLLEQMIEEQILSRAAVDDGLDREPAVAKRLEASRRQILSQAYLDRRHEIATQVSDEDAQEFYREHRDEYLTEKTLRVRVLNNSDEKIARRAREMVVDDGVPFPAVCSRFNERPQLIKAQGLLPDWVRRGRAVAWLGNSSVFHDAVFALEKGEVSEVFETVHGFNLAMVDDVREAQQLSFEEARGDIMGRISRARSSGGLPELMTELKERYRVKIHEAPTKSPEELFTEAQGAPDPGRKVELFEQLVERYPNDSHVLEALFMIGFTRAEELDDPDGARAAFRRVIDEFPDSELAQSARWMLSSGESDVPAFEGEGTVAQE